MTGSSFLEYDTEKNKWIERPIANVSRVNFDFEIGLCRLDDTALKKRILADRNGEMARRIKAFDSIKHLYSL